MRLYQSGAVSSREIAAAEREAETEERPGSAPMLQGRLVTARESARQAANLPAATATVPATVPLSAEVPTACLQPLLSLSAQLPLPEDAEGSTSH